jgi:hypothetical protein
MRLKRLISIGNCKFIFVIKQLYISFSRPEKPDELPDADDAGPKDDDNEIDVNKIDEEMFNKVF